MRPHRTWQSQFRLVIMMDSPNFLAIALKTACLVLDTQNHLIPQLLSEMSEDITVFVNCCDDQVVKTDFETMKQSQVFLDMVGALNIDNRETGRMEFPAKKVKGATMENVVEWCKNHINVPEPEVKEQPDTKERIWFDLTEQETDFFKALQTQEVIELANAADYLGIHHLYIFCCQNLAQRIKDVNLDPEKIREMFDLPDDLTEQEKNEIKEKNVWCNY